MLSRREANKTSVQSNYKIHKFVVRKDYAYVNDVLILNTSKHIMWVGTTDKNVSFLVTSPSESIYTSNFLSNSTSFNIQETRLFLLNENDTHIFDKTYHNTTKGNNTSTTDEFRYNFTSHEYFNCSINTEQQNIMIWHNTKGPKDKKYTQENYTDFICGEE